MHLGLDVSTCTETNQLEMTIKVKKNRENIFIKLQGIRNIQSV